MSSKKLSLAEKYSQLINPTPFQDPEDDFIHEETAARVVDQFGEDSDEEAAEPGVSDLRQKNAQVLGLVDGRYAGEKVSRRRLEQDSSEDDIDSNDEGDEKHSEIGDVDDIKSSDENSAVDDTEVLENDQSEENGSVLEGKQSDDESEGETSEIDEDDGDMFLSEEGEEEEEENEKSFQHFSSTDKGAEVDKGNAVRNQLALWDGILEFRIQIQKCLVASNQMPLASKFNEFKSKGGKEFVSAQSKCTKKVSTLLESLLKLQGELLKKNPETKGTSSGKKQPTSAADSDEEIPSSEDEEQDNEEEETVKQPAQKKRKLEDFSSALTTDHKKFLDFRNTTIQKWNDKTRVAQGRLNSKNFSAFEQSTVKQIEQVLADKPRLLKRTRTKRSSYRILGESDKSSENNEDQDEESTQEQCSEVFDDDDFYHQLLRELIEHKSEGVTDPIQLGRQWIALQKLRSKMKRKIDTRATKGRKIRYTVQPKLVNFMAPYDKGTWTDNSKTELFHSLFATS